MKYVNLLLFGLFISCNIPTILFDGNISSYIRKMDGGFERITLKDDKTFIYQYQIGLIEQQCEGVWNVIDNDLILNTHARFSTGVIQAEESQNDEQFIQLLLVDQEEVPLRGATITINGNQYLYSQTDNFGFESFPEGKPIINIVINYLGSDYEYRVKSEDSNRFQLSIRATDLSRCEKENEAWKIKSSHKLVHPNNGELELEK